MIIQVLVLAGLVGGCMAFLSGCRGSEDEDTDESLSSNSLENHLDQQTDTGEAVVEFAEVTCTCAKDDSDTLYLGADNNRVNLVQLPELTEKDIEMTNNGKFKYCTYWKKPCPGAVIEDNEWKLCDAENSQGVNGKKIDLLNSFMMCMSGYGIIYLLNSGQSPGSLKNLQLEHLLEIFESWWTGEKIVANEGIEPIFTELDKAGMLEEYKERYIINKEQFLAMGFPVSQAEPFMIMDMNRVLEKYEINTRERLRHFFAQCFVESGSCQNLTVEGYDEVPPRDLSDRKYYPYIGTGHIQLTNRYSYQAFATYVTLNNYPELQDTVQYQSPAHNDSGTINDKYNQLLVEAEKLGIDISEITQIGGKSDKEADTVSGNDTEENVQPTEAIYIAKNYAWEAAGYFWETGEANEIVNSLQPGDPNGVDRITDVVNKKTASRPKRKKAYQDVMEVINEEDFPN